MTDSRESGGREATSRDEPVVANRALSGLPDVGVALGGSGHAFAVTDPNRPDNPLVWVNEAFERVTGYRSADVLGRNCRFLQGPETDPAAVTRIRVAIAAGEPLVETLLNYRPDGSTWYNRVAISPVYDQAGALINFVGVQTDVTDLVAAETQRRDARLEAEQAWARLRLLADASTLLSGTLDPDVAVQRLTELVVPQLADWCSVLLVDPEPVADAAPGGARMTLTHRDPALDEIVARVLRIYQPRTDDATPQSQVLRTGQPVLLANVGTDYIDQAARDDELAQAWRKLGMRSCIVVPLPAQNRRIGCLTLVSSESGRAYTDSDVAFAADLGRRAGLALDNARLYAAEHRTALILQRNLLPDVPAVRGLTISATYLPGADLAEVGGDWYDVTLLRDGVVGLAVGDVMGHSIDAAAAMGQLRSMLRGFAWDDPDPRTVLQRLDQATIGLGITPFATCIYARIEPAVDGGCATLRWANAGHPPMMVRTSDGQVQTLSGGHRPALGVNADAVPYDEGRLPLRPGSVLLLYSDGLVEDPRRDLEDGLDELRSALADYSTGPGSLDRLAGRLAAAVAAPHRDDVCMLLIEVDRAS